MVLRERGLRAGVAAAALLAALGAVQMVTAQSGERTISLYNIHSKETVTVVYKRGGKYVEAGLERVNHVMRDWRRNETTKMDPELVDLIWEMHHELGSKEPVHIISGYRSRATNDQLRKTVGGQASESRHILGKAADVHFPDVPLKSMRYSALVREKGGVGYYPTSALPFVHVDTDRVRAWPRLPRYELALLFPSGATKHAPADGGPITKEDVRVAQGTYRDLAVQVAAFHGSRSGGPKLPLAVATATPPTVEPRLIAAPKPIAAAAPTITAPSASDRAKLSELAALASAAPQLLVGPQPARRPQPALASLTGSSLPAPGILQVNLPPAPKVASLEPAAVKGGDRLNDLASDPSGNSGRFGWGTNWAPAAAYDEEHPEELSYRPFPIAPFLTQTASEPLMAELVHHDVARTIDMIDQPGTALPMRLRPGEQAARLLWAQQFTGEAVGLSKLQEARPVAPETAKPTGLQSRSVRTSQK